MPYITQKQREKFEQFFDFTDMIENEGELNYVITIILKKYLNNKKLNYNTLNSIMGVMNCASFEFYRKVIAPYEEKKEKENGSLD
jgi:hypothetical protein